MSALVSMLSTSGQSEENPSLFPLGSFQKMVKDEVAFAPVPNPHELLREAIERMTSHQNPVKEQEKP